MWNVQNMQLMFKNNYIMKFNYIMKSWIFLTHI